MLLLTCRTVQQGMLVQIDMIGEVFYSYIVGESFFQIPCMENFLIRILLHCYIITNCLFVKVC